MKIQPAITAIATGAAAIKSATSVAIIVGAVYLVDCRTNSKTEKDIDRCWMTALPIMGLGGVGRGAYEVGYSTYNPALRKERD